MNIIYAEPLTPNAFAPFGDVIDITQTAPLKINAGQCERYHDLAKLEIDGGAYGISLFQANIRALPYEFDLMERHPKGSQAFLPMCQNGFLVIVAPDDGATPATPRAFLTQIGQGVNIHKNTWHGVLTPLAGSGLFGVIDRAIGDDNLVEYHLKVPYIVHKEK